MATRSYIAKALPNGNVKLVYCHYDGYLSYNGNILKEHYNSEALADELISGGDMSSLRESIKDIEYYTKRGEDLHITETDNWKALFAESWCEYFYLYSSAEQKWLYATHSEDVSNIILKEV